MINWIATTWWVRLNNRKPFDLIKSMKSLLSHEIYHHCLKISFKAIIFDEKRRRIKYITSDVRAK